MASLEQSTHSWLLIVWLLFFYNYGVVGDGGAQRTLAMVKPDCVRENHSEAIKTNIRSSGFVIVEEKIVKLDTITAEGFYSEHSGRTFFPSLIEFMTSGPVVILILEHEDAVAKWRALLGPTDPKMAQSEQPKSIRAIFGTDTTQNCVHGSDSLQSAAREITFFFNGNKKDEDALSEHDEL